MGTQTFNESLPISDTASFANADGNNSKTVTAQRPVPSRIDAIVCSSTVAVDHVVNVFYHPPGGFDITLGSVNVPANSGLNGTKGVELLAGILPTNVVGWAMEINGQISVGMAVTIASGNIRVSCQGGTL